MPEPYFAAMGRHNRDEADDRTEPFPVLQQAMALLEAKFSSEEETDPHGVSVAEVMARIASEGHGVRLAWTKEDEHRAANENGGRQAGDFPTAVLSAIRETSSNTKES